MKKKMQWKDFLLLQVVFLIYSFTSLTQKLASSFLPKDAGTTEELVRQLLNWKLILSAGSWYCCLVYMHCYGSR